MSVDGLVQALCYHPIIPSKSLVRLVRTTVLQKNGGKRARSVAQPRNFLVANTYSK